MCIGCASSGSIPTLPPTERPDIFDRALGHVQSEQSRADLCDLPALRCILPSTDIMRLNRKQALPRRVGSSWGQGPWDCSLVRVCSVGKG